MIVCLSDSQETNRVPWNKGKTGYSTSWKGRHHSEETKRKLSRSRMGKPAWNLGKTGVQNNNGMRGRHHSPETIEKIKEKALSRSLNPKFIEAAKLYHNSIKGKTYEEIYGAKKAELLRKQRSEDNKEMWRVPEIRMQIQNKRLLQVLPRKDTSIERIIQSQIHAPFRTHIPIIGQPDIYIPASNLYIFADGCWFHCCPICYSDEYYMRFNVNFKSIRQYDDDITKKLESTGAKVLRFWGHEITAKGFTLKLEEEQN